MADRTAGAAGPGNPPDPGDAVDAHAGHDPEIVASLLDSDLGDADRAAAERQVAGCSACAALHRDLLVLASVARELPPPARTLDFRLTAADAARLGEPLASTARLTGDMQTIASHASHDTILVASLADHSLPMSDREAGEALVAACGLCAGLSADLVALTAATRAMPTPARSRDYSLTPDDATRLRPRGWRRWLAAFGTSRDAFSRPLAVGLTTLGLAGLLVATVPSALQGLPAAGFGASSSALSPVGAPVPQGVPEVGTDTSLPVAGAAAAAAASQGGASASLSDLAGVPVAGPIVTDGASPAPVFGALADGATKGSAPESAPSGRTDMAGAPQDTVLGYTSGVSPMILVSAALLIVGAGLFLIRWGARRFGD